MTINLAAAARVIPLAALLLGACVSEKTYEQQTQELQQARAQAAFASYFAPSICDVSV